MRLVQLLLRPIGRLLLALFVALTLTALLVQPSVALAAVLGDDYPANLKAADRDALVDPWNFYNRECTSFTAWRLNNANGVGFHNYYLGVHWGNANNWGPAARAAGIGVDMSPAVGAVAWFNSGVGGASSLGHVAWVAEVGVGTVTIEEYNYGSYGAYNKRTIATGAVSGYIHVKDLPTAPPDRDRDSVPDAQDQCPDQAGPAGQGGCPGDIVATSANAISAPGGWSVWAPIRQAFTVRNNSSAPVSIRLLIWAIRDPYGTNYDRLCAEDLVLQPGESKSCDFTANWGSPGAYTVWPAWLDLGEAWHAVPLSPTANFTLSATPLVTVSPVETTAPTGWHRWAPIRHTFTVKNVSSSPLSIPLLILAFRDPYGANYDRLCARDITLAPGEMNTCTSENGWGSTGTYRIWPAWTDTTGSWHAYSLGPETTFTLDSVPLISSAPVAASPADGYRVGAPITFTFTVKNTSGEPLGINVLALAMRDPTDRNVDVGCASNLTLPTDAAHTCRVTATPQQVGTYTMWGAWTNTSDQFHGFDLGPVQKFTVSTATVAADAPSRAEACGTSLDTYVIPPTEGVEYLVDGVMRAAGSYPTRGAASVLVTARAKAGYALSGNSSWTLAFDTASCELTGTVATNAGTPVAGAKIAVFNATTGAGIGSTTTNSDGVYNLGNLTVTSVKVKASKDGYQTVYQDGTTSLTSAAAVSLTSGTTTIDISLPALKTLTGTVTSAGTPVAGVKIAAFNATTGAGIGSTTTNSDGVYTLGNLTATSVKVKATKDGYHTIYQDGKTSLTSAAAVPLASAGTTTVDFRLTSRQTVTGTVTSAGSPIAGVKIAVFDATTGKGIGSTTTNSDGVYNLGNLTATSVKVKATKDGYRTVYQDGTTSLSAAAPVALTPAASTTINITLTPTT